MYNETSFQIQYRRKIFEAIATLAYSRNDAFRWIPYQVVSDLEPIANEVTSDLDYVTESCSAALGIDPANYRDVFFRPVDRSVQSAEKIDFRQTSFLCTLKSVCHKCSTVMGEDRPCARACTHGAISTDSSSRTVIDSSRCKSCGKCLLACPYGAIIDRSSILQTIRVMQTGRHVYAILLPGMSEQFTKYFSETELTEAFRILGFFDTLELESVQRTAAHKDECLGWRSYDRKSHVTCCAANFSAWTSEIKSETQAVLSDDPGACFTLAVPCPISKLEAARIMKELSVDFILDFEELTGMMDARCLTHDMIRENELEELKHFV